MANRWGIPKEVEIEVKSRDKQCIYCRIKFEENSTINKNKPTWEHIVNDIRLNQVNNIALCCMSCNASKGSKLILDWLETEYCKRKNINIRTIAEVVKNVIKNPPSV